MPSVTQAWSKCNNVLDETTSSTEIPNDKKTNNDEEGLSEADWEKMENLISEKFRVWPKKTENENTIDKEIDYSDNFEGVTLWAKNQKQSFTSK